MNRVDVMRLPGCNETVDGRLVTLTGVVNQPEMNANRVLTV